MKILLFLVITFSSIFANEGRLFTFNNGTAGGEVADTMTFVYQKKKSELTETDEGVRNLARVAKKQICSDKEMKGLVDDGLSVQFIYAAPTKIAIVVIDSCK
jgi:hypothetical protein